MFTSSLKFYENTSFDEALKSKDTEFQERCAKILNTKDWVMEHEVKISCEGSFNMKEILEKNGIKYADILYDFKGNIYVEYGPYGVIFPKIEEKTFTRDVPYYYSVNIYRTLNFKVQGEISFKVGVLDTNTRKKIYKAAFDLPFSNEYFIRYYAGGAYLIHNSQKLKKIINLQKFCRKNFRYFLFKRWIKSQEFTSWFYAPENFGGYKTKLKLLKQISLI